MVGIGGWLELSNVFSKFTRSSWYLRQMRSRDPPGGGRWGRGL